MDKLSKLIGESFLIYLKIMAQIFIIVAKAFVLYAPVVLLWLIAIEANFDGATFVATIQGLTKEPLVSLYQTLGFFISLIFIPVWYIRKVVLSRSDNAKRIVKNPLNQKEKYHEQDASMA